MDIVCGECSRAYIDGEWVEDTLPIRRVSQSTCPACLAKKNEGAVGSRDGGMVYQQKKRAGPKKKKKGWLW